MRKHHGQEGRAYIIVMGSGGPGPAVMGCELNEWTLEQSADRAETTSFCDANRTYVPGKRDMSGSLSGYFDSESDLLFAGAESPDGVYLYLYPSVLVPDQFWHGPASMDASITVNVGNPITIEGEWAATGSWTRAHP